MNYPIDQLENLFEAERCDMLSLHELSIGDWLQKTIVDPRNTDEQTTIPVQIRGMFTDAAGYDNIIYYHPIEAMEISAILQHFTPLPLTDVLLKGSGAVMEEIGDNGPGTPPEYRNRFERWEIKTEWKDKTLWYDRRTHKWSVSGANQIYIEYAHQLQHILRLLNIPWIMNPQDTFAPWIKTQK